MDLATDFTAILIRYGHNVYVQRRKSAEETGPYRLVDGGRYEAYVEKFTTYRRFPTRDAKDAMIVPAGILDDSDVIFYFQPEAGVKSADLISEDSPHERTERETYRVEKAVPFYMGNHHIYTAAY
jgi:hypothetical protein